MRPDPNTLAQAMIRLLNDKVLPGAGPGVEITVRRITAILRDTDWSGAHRIAQAEATRLRTLVAELAEIGHPVEPPPSFADGYTTAAADDVIGLRRGVTRSVVALASQDMVNCDRVRRKIAKALADCAEYGLKQTSAPPASRGAKEET